MEHFDYESVARDAGVKAEQLDQLRRVVLRDYANDPLLFELHMLRACRAIRDGEITLEQAVAVDAGVASLSAPPAATTPSSRPSTTTWRSRGTK